ncbi:hypothetical protein ACCD06_33715 [Azospirillum sp. CT11-132]|uniref:hypothetical protein n=1 Tax=Azospirillum sp. CT11-132 TaxID=3396317 RepID=UPI0039A52775
MTSASYLGDLRRLAQDATSLRTECEALHSAILCLRAGGRISLSPDHHAGLRRQIGDAAAGLLPPITLVGAALVMVPEGFCLETAAGGWATIRPHWRRGGEVYTADRLWSLALSIADACLWAHVHDLTSGEVRP